MNNPCGMKGSNTAAQILNDLLPHDSRPQLIRSEQQIQRTPVDSLLDQRPAPVLVTDDIDAGGILRACAELGLTDGA